MCASELIKQLSDQNFKEGISKGIVLVDFYADWCGPCRMLAPVVEELAKEMSGKIIIAKVNTDQSVGIATEYEITSIPTIIIFKNGEIVKRMIGLKDLDSLRKSVSELI